VQTFLKKTIYKKLGLNFHKIVLVCDS